MNRIAPFSRRQFLSDASRFSALSALAGVTPLPLFSTLRAGEPIADQTPIADAGFAAVYKVADGHYATISNTSKGFTTICNGGFLFGKEAGLLLEGFGTPGGARFQMDAFHQVAQVAAAGALLTHYHFDHSMPTALGSSHLLKSACRTLRTTRPSSMPRAILARLATSLTWPIKPSSPSPTGPSIPLSFL